jgi:SAM-dependent methyltransferase
MRLVPQRETLKIIFRPWWVRPMSLPPFWRPERGLADPNRMFSRHSRKELLGHVQRLRHRDEKLRKRLSDPRIAGVRAWEYGNLLATLQAYPARTSWRAIDIGSGWSTFPHYLLAEGHVSEMTTLDLPDANEPLSAVQAQDEAAVGLRRIEGSMLDLPLPADSFDLVTCISAIEHLDGDRLMAQREPDRLPSREEYVELTRTALLEMARVLAPGGLLYVTSDAYIPELQRTDAWSSPDGDSQIMSAYHFDDIEQLFVAAVRSAGLELVGEADFRRELLERDAQHSSYRGRYFTTFAIAATKPASSNGNPAS